MTQTTSTIPGAASALYGYMQTVAAANLLTVPTQAFYGGIPKGVSSDNVLMVGSYEEGFIWRQDTLTWPVLPATAKQREEEYALIGCVQCWAGDFNPQQRLADAFKLLDALRQQIDGDLNGGGALSTTGCWGAVELNNTHNGPINGAGWGVVIEFDLHVTLARIFG